MRTACMEVQLHSVQTGSRAMETAQFAGHPVWLRVCYMPRHTQARQYSKHEHAHGCCLIAQVNLEERHGLEGQRTSPGKCLSVTKFWALTPSNGVRSLAGAPSRGCRNRWKFSSPPTSCRYIMYWESSDQLNCLYSKLQILTICHRISANI